MKPQLLSTKTPLAAGMGHPFAPFQWDPSTHPPLQHTKYQCLEARAKRRPTRIARACWKKSPVSLTGTKSPLTKPLENSITKILRNSKYYFDLANKNKLLLQLNSIIKTPIYTFFY